MNDKSLGIASLALSAMCAHHGMPGLFPALFFALGVYQFILGDPLIREGLQKLAGKDAPFEEQKSPPARD